jgi:hypothetical protein
MAAEIHKRLRFYEKHHRRVDPRFADECLPPVVLPRARSLMREFVNHSEAKVVALPRIILPRITKTDNYYLFSRRCTSHLSIAPIFWYILCAQALRGVKGRPLGYGGNASVNAADSSHNPKADFQYVA